MATLSPFRALRPRPGDASRIAAVPYDVVNTAEARALADGNPLSFLRVSRAELELPSGTDPFSEIVYDRAARNFETLRQSVLVIEDEPSLYLYRLRAGGHEQTGLAGCYSLAEYDRGIIRRHERTRRDKEDDRTRHLIALRAQTGPVFLTYRASPEVDRLASRVTGGPSLFDFEAPDQVRHTIWRVPEADRASFVEAFARIPTLYIADGHHRAASAARARLETVGMRDASLADRANSSTMLAVAFPDTQVRILPYNRIVRTLGQLSTDAFLQAVDDRFEREPGAPRPPGRGTISMYAGREWHELRPRVMPDRTDVVGSLDVSILQDQLLAPILKITDVRTDQRIDFVGGARGTDALKQTVDSGQAAAAFSLYPVDIGDLMKIADEDAIMPPKSTWFEPKLRDGLLIHLV